MVIIPTFLATVGIMTIPGPMLKARHAWMTGYDFTEQARNITFRIEGQSDAPVLRAELQGDFRIDYVAGDVNLAEHIYNSNGQLQYRSVRFLCLFASSSTR